MNQVELYSEKSFTVYKELSFVDKSLDIEKAKVVNTTELIRVLPTWTSTKVKIRKGTHLYPGDVITWPTVKQFIKQGIVKVISSNFLQEEETKETKVTKTTKTTKSSKPTSLEDLVPEN